MTDLTLADISNFIAAGESETAEFKTSFNDEAIEAIGAFSNARGGVVLIGVKDHGEVSGIQIGKKTVEYIANRIQEATDPRLQPSISVIAYGDKDVLGIQVCQNVGIPVSVRGRFFRRAGCTNQRMSHEEIMQRMVASTGLSWDVFPEPGTTLQDLDFSLVERFIQTTNKLGRRPIPEQISAEEFLRKLELIKDNIPTRAALLLFGKSPNSYFSSAFLKIGRFRSPTVIVDDREVGGPLIQQLDEAMQWFRERLTTEFIITGKPQRDVHWEYPLNAIREAVINILCHRDYTSGAHSQIRLYDDHLELWNAGGLPSPLTPNDLFQEHDSVPRNRKIADVFFYMGLIERWGSGTLRITEELEREGFPKPTFISNSGRFKIILNKRFAVKEDFSQNITLSHRQSQAIAYVEKHGSISNSKYQELTGVSKRTATRDLNDLKEKNIFISEGSSGLGIIYKMGSK